MKLNQTTTIDRDNNMENKRSAENHSSEIVVQRTEKLEALLQKLWKLRPEYEDQLSITIFSAVGALIREAERADGARLKAWKYSRFYRSRQKPEPTAPGMTHPDSEWD